MSERKAKRYYDNNKGRRVDTLFDNLVVVTNEPMVLCDKNCIFFSRTRGGRGTRVARLGSNAGNCRAANNERVFANADLCLKPDERKTS